MEKEGLSRALQFLENHHLAVATLITDRHKQVSKFLCKKYPHIEHHYDVWHISKGMFIIHACSRLTTHLHAPMHYEGLKKKLAKLSKYKDCEIVGEWTKSIINHLYWCAASAPDGDGKQMVVRWRSLGNHLCNEHHDCYHLPLGERQKKWFTPGKS